MVAADPADIDGRFEGPPLVSLDPDILSPLLSSGIHTRRQDLWDDIWTALSAASVDVAEPPGIRTDAHDFVRDGLRMSRCALPGRYTVAFYLMLAHPCACSLQYYKDLARRSQSCKFRGNNRFAVGPLLMTGMPFATTRFPILLLLCLHLKNVADIRQSSFISSIHIYF